MEEETKNDECCIKVKKDNNKGCGSCGCGAVYGLGVIGAAVYFIQNAGTFWIGALGVLKAFVWPAFLVFKFFEFFKF